MEKRSEITRALKTVKKEKWGLNEKDAIFIVSHILEKKPDKIVESGRKRGYSSEILAKLFPEKKITSIDFDKDSKHSSYAEKKLSKFDNLELVYGDARDIIYDYLDEKTYVFIDGPKGHEAILLTCKLYQDENVVSIALDDFPKDDFYTYILESIFPGVMKGFEEDGDSSVIIDKDSTTYRREVLRSYVEWVDNIRPFYTKYTYKLKPGIIRKLLSWLKNE